ncbi:acyl-CoA oxidase [Aureococcus anophagefferens]|nr:acyl-CoA oxidase [Aureococcus anophagefferens]
MALRAAFTRVLPQARGLRAAVITRAPAPFSTAAVAPRDEEAEWEAAFLEATDVVSGDSDHTESSEALRALVKSGLLKHTDLRDRPDRFFKAHRLLARHAVREGPGFWIRFTVHYNLCFGTVLAVGGPEQVAAMADVEAQGQLGCFALTERLAGVQSGWATSRTRPSSSRTRPSATSGRPAAFLMDLASPGVSTGDMGVKTTGNDLDNAWIAFDNVRVPRTALLNGHCGVGEATGGYVLKTQGVKPFEMIGQRLYTGRVAVAQAALAFRSQLFDVTKAYADNKSIPDVARTGAAPKLSGIPQLKALFAEADETAALLEDFVNKCEDRLAPLLRTGAVPDEELAHAIATAKVKAVEHSIDLAWRLKQEVGSYALMGSSGFKHLDFLNCCKFAEGDSRILMQKMARDRVRKFAADLKAGAADDGTEEARLAGELAAALAPARGDKAQQAALWDEHDLLVYALAEQMMDRTIREF